MPTTPEHALDLIESADLDQLVLVLAAAPETAEGITGALTHTVIALATDNHDAARQLAEAIAKLANQTSAKPSKSAYGPSPAISSTRLPRLA